jgi:putative nucleotidyltransferase-like protein
MRTALARAIDGGALPDGCSSAALVDAAIAHDVAPFVARSRIAETLDPESLSRLREHVRVTALRCAAMDAELRRVLSELSRAGVRPLVVKGAHLAHAVYPVSTLRPRADTDLLIRPGDRDRAADVLRACGYEPTDHVRGRVILGQFHFERVDRAGIAHYFDVHWRAAAPLMVESLVPSDALFAAAAPVPGQGPDAQGPTLGHALLLACVHLVAHHWPRPDLLWLYDVRAIVERMTVSDRDLFLDAVARGQCCALAAAALDASRETFPSDAVSALASRVRSATSARESSAALLRVRRPVQALWIDLRSAGWRDRARLLREHLLPDREFMERHGNGGPLAFAYARRAAHGLRRWMRISGAGRTAERDG